MINCFETEVAKDVGVIAAVLYQNIQYWCEHNRANRINEYDGYFWTFNSIEAFTELFPYLTKNQINLALKKLEESGYIKTGNYNKSAYDRTKWYTDIKGGCGVLSEDSPISTKTEMEINECENGSMPNHKPIPNINTNINQITNLKEKSIKKKFDAIAYLDTIPGMVKDPEIKDVFVKFIEMRESIKHPITTEYGLKQLIKKAWELGDFKKDKIIAVINQSIESGYRGLFELKGNNNQIAPRTAAPSQASGFSGHSAIAALDAIIAEEKAKEANA